MKFRTTNGPISVNIATFGELKEQLANRLRARDGFSMATLNLDHLAKMSRDASFYAAYQTQEFVVADGNPIVWMSAMSGKRIELMPGSDLVLPLSKLAAEQNRSVALVGSTQEVLDKAEKVLRAQIPNLDIVEKTSPPYGFNPDGEEAIALMEKIKASDAGLCFLAFGAPKQEILGALGASIAPRTGFISVGAGLDFLAGHQERAPAWVRNLAMEWLWRLLQSPRRMGPRYAKCFAVLPGHSFRSLLGRVTSSQKAATDQVLKGQSINSAAPSPHDLKP